MTQMYRRYLRETRRATVFFRLAQARERLALAVKGRPNPSSTIIVAGSGRGGTTWLARLIAMAPGVQIIFEPLHPVRVLPVVGFDGASVSRDVQESIYLRPGWVEERWERYFQKVLVGEVRNWWTDQERYHTFTWRYVVKMIRANLMLAWLDEHFECSIVLIVRHPCAVVRSRLVRGWSAPVERLLDQPALMEDYLYPYAAIAHTAQSDLERHAVLWAIETQVALQQMQGRDRAFIFYETLCTQPVVQVRALCARFGLPFTAGMEKAIQRQSLVRDERGVLVSKERLIDRWQHDMPRSDQGRVLEIVRAFDIFLYDETPYPLVTEDRLEIAG